MVSAGTKRKRKERENRIAAAVEEGRAKAAAERRALGTVVTPDVPDKSLFVEDRSGKSKDDLQQEFYQQAAEQRRAAKRARRNAPKVRKSESAIVRAEMGSISVPKHKKKTHATVDLEILAKRKFDKPRGHVGNVSEVIRQSKVFTNGEEDVWASETAKSVSEEIGLNRRRLTQKMNKRHRQAQPVIHPAGGLSMNPTYADHQDKLGEELARIVDHDDYNAFIEEKLKFDPALLKESTEGEIGDTGMKGDDSDAPDDDSDDEPPFAKAATGERKTQSQRNKEARKREMVANLAKKRAETKLEEDLDNIEVVAEEARQAAEKLSGEEKIRRRREITPLPRPVDRPIHKKLSGQKVQNENANVPIPLSSELSESMRSVKMPVANPLLRDRFLSFERRGIIEPPKVLPKELWRMEQAKRQELLKDRRKRKGRGSRSNLTFWKNGKSAVK